MKKNIFLTFCFSFVPGAGQMYQGYMKRGLSILILFSAFAAIFGTVSIPLFIIPLPVIYIYSFFDTFYIRNSFSKEEKIEDNFIWNDFNLDSVKNSLNISNNKKLIGIILVFIGLYIIISNILPQLFYDLDLKIISNMLYTLSSYITPIAIAALSIVIGIKLIGRK